MAVKDADNETSHSCRVVSNFSAYFKSIAVAAPLF